MGIKCEMFWCERIKNLHSGRKIGKVTNGKGPDGTLYGVWVQPLLQSRGIWSYLPILFMNVFYQFESVIYWFHVQIRWYCPSKPSPRSPIASARNLDSLAGSQIHCCLHRCSRSFSSQISTLLLCLFVEQRCQNPPVNRRPAVVWTN